MCNQSGTATVTEPATTRSVEEMLRDIALVLRMTGQLKAELREERVERETTRIQLRGRRVQESLAVSV